MIEFDGVNLTENAPAGACVLCVDLRLIGNLIALINQFMN
jgi:hypothetical protein